MTTQRQSASKSRFKQRMTDLPCPAAARAWQLQAAKAKFSELFRLARAGSPQFVTRGGTDAVVIIPVERYERPIARSRQSKSLVEFFRQSPLAGSNLLIERCRDTGRTVEL
jgi:prevent-host-death family protein